MDPTTNVANSILAHTSSHLAHFGLAESCGGLGRFRIGPQGNVLGAPRFGRAWVARRTAHRPLPCCQVDGAIQSGPGPQPGRHSLSSRSGAHLWWWRLGSRIRITDRSLTASRDLASSADQAPNLYIDNGCYHTQAGGEQQVGRRPGPGDVQFTSASCSCPTQTRMSVRKSEVGGTNRGRAASGQPKLHLARGLRHQQGDGLPVPPFCRCGKIQEMARDRDVQAFDDRPANLSSDS